MRDWKGDWEKKKKELKKVGVDTGVFKQDLGSKTAVFEKALKKVNKAKGTYRRDDAEMVKLRKDLSKACNIVYPVCVEYEKITHYLGTNATDSSQKKACNSAAGFLREFVNEVRETSRE